MQRESEDTLLLCQSKVAELSEEINQLEKAKSRLEWIAVGTHSYQKLKRLDKIHAIVSLFVNSCL